MGDVARKSSSVVGTSAKGRKRSGTTSSAGVRVLIDDDDRCVLVVAVATGAGEFGLGRSTAL